MKCGIGADKSESVAHHTDHEGNSLGLPSTIIHPCPKNLLRVAVGTKGDQRDQDSEEPKNVKDQNETLELGQNRADKRVDEDSKDEDGPEQHSAMPELGHVCVPVQSRHSEDHVTSEQSTRGNGSLPAADSEPTGNVAQKLGARSRSKHGHPMILSARRWRHGHQLAHGGEDAKVAHPDNEEAVDDTGSSTIVEALGEEDSDGFPCNQNGATKSKNRHESKVTLSRLVECTH